MEIKTLHEQALRHTARLVAAIGGHQWDAPTPCPKWTVRDLVNHLVTGNLWVRELGRGRTIEEVGTALEGDLLSQDPVATHTDSVTAAIAAFGADGAMERLWHLSFGPRPGRVYARQRFIDVLIHGWDIATATGQDTRLPEEPVAECLSYLEAKPEVRKVWGFATVDPPATGGPQERLLALTGRRP